MAIIEDVSPTLSNMSFNSSFNFASGRMLSLASADDGKLVFAGSLSSGLWASEDGGDNWAQVEWPQPDAGPEPSAKPEKHDEQAEQPLLGAFVTHDEGDVVSVDAFDGVDRVLGWLQISFPA